MSPARARVALLLLVALTLAACSSLPEPAKVLVFALDSMARARSIC